MATASEIQSGEAAWEYLDSRYTFLKLTTSISVTEKNTIQAVFDRTKPGSGIRWQELVQGKTTLAKYLGGLEVVRGELNSIEARDGLILSTIKRFYTEVVVQTGSDIAEGAASLKDAAVPVWAGIVVVLILVLAIKLT